MIKWLDLNFKGDRTEAISTFAEKFEMGLDEADDLFKVWLRVENHQNWYDELEGQGEEDCDDDGNTWQ